MREPGESLRVLQVISNMGFGGAERVIQQLVRSLHGHGFLVDVCCSRETGEMSQELADEGYRVESFADVGPYEVTTRLAQLVRERQYEIVHTHDASTLFDAAGARLRGTRARLVHTYHFGNYPYVKRRYLYGERMVHWLAHGLVAVSEAQRSQITRHLWVPPRRIGTIYNGISVESFRPSGNPRAFREELGISDEQTMVISVAVMTEQKGIPVLLDAAQRIRCANLPITFVLVGGGSLWEAMRERARALGLEPTVRFTGPRTDIARVLAGADLVVSSSLWEGFAIVLLEAMAAGKAIVATAVGDNSRAVADGETGLLVPPGDAEALAGGIIELASDRERRSRMGSAALARVEAEFATQRMAAAYARLYRQTVGHAIP